MKSCMHHYEIVKTTHYWTPEQSRVPRPQTNLGNPEALLHQLPAPEFKIKKANGTIVTVKKQVVLKFS